MAPFCREENIAMTPYSALAGGRLSKRPGETSQRLEQDLYAKGKYDAARPAGRGRSSAGWRSWRTGGASP